MRIMEFPMGRGMGRADCMPSKLGEVLRARCTKPALAASESEPAETLAGVRGDGSSRDCLRTIGPCGPMGENSKGHPEIPIPPVAGFSRAASGP